jgi:hypothetical protein
MTNSFYKVISLLINVKISIIMLFYNNDYVSNEFYF